jgi:hypothetical protein
MTARELKSRDLRLVWLLRPRSWMFIPLPSRITPGEEAKRVETANGQSSIDLYKTWTPAACQMHF